MLSADGTTGSSWPSSARSGRAATSSIWSSSRPSFGERAPLPARRDRVVPRRRHEQLHLEPLCGRSAGSVATSPIRAFGSSWFPRSLALRQPRSSSTCSSRRLYPAGCLSAGHRDRAGHPAELRREQALVVRAALAAFVAGARACGACGSRDDAQRHGQRAGLRRGRASQSRRRSCRPRRRCPWLTEDQATKILLRYPKVVGVARSVSAQAADRRQVSGRDRRMDREKRGRETRARSCSARWTTTPAV